MQYRTDGKLVVICCVQILLAASLSVKVLPEAFTTRFEHTCGGEYRVIASINMFMPLLNHGSRQLSTHSCEHVSEQTEHNLHNRCLSIGVDADLQRQLLCCCGFQTLVQHHTSLLQHALDLGVLKLTVSRV